MMLHVTEGLVRPAQDGSQAQLRLGIVFLDLSSYTSLTDVMGDRAAATIVERFSEIVHEAATRFDGRVVDRVGDALLMVFPDPTAAVTCALEIERTVAAEPQFPAVRGAVHWGEVLYQGGGYIGGSLNVASRVAAAASPHQIVVTAAVRSEIGALAGVTFVPLGKRLLKGVIEELELFEARPDRGRLGERTRDPVCGVEMAPTEVGVALTVKGEKVAFCCEKCLRVFLDAPQKYRKQLLSSHHRVVGSATPR
jgi:adenylate cyclase